MLSTQLIDSYETEGYSNRPLSQIEICKILDEHGISWEYNSEKVLFAVDRGIDEYTNTTNWQLFDLLAFLNY